MEPIRKGLLFAFRILVLIPCACLGILVILGASGVSQTVGHEFISIVEEVSQAARNGSQTHLRFDVCDAYQERPDSMVNGKCLESRSIHVTPKQYVEQAYRYIYFIYLNFVALAFAIEICLYAFDADSALSKRAIDNYTESKM